MKKFKRAFLIVLDSLGAGAMPDAEEFGDSGASTLGSLKKSDALKISNLLDMGLGNIDSLSFLGSVSSPIASYARMSEASKGKDTTIGHWEIAGHISNSPLPTFPNGFPDDLITEFSRISGKGVLCNRPYSGTDVIRDFGEEHLRSEKLIVYTSADSVFQIAAHEEVLGVDELYAVCEKARAMLVGKYGVGRVIARPFAGKAPNFYRTDLRRDFSLEPPKRLLPEAFFDTGLDSIAIGKIGDIFADKKFTKKVLTHSNDEGMAVAEDFLSKDFSGLCFINLVDFDMKYGHRRDVLGYTEALNAFDRFIGDFIKKMRYGDILFITADHGCDPAFSASTDHTREYTPLLIYSNDIIPEKFGTRTTFADIAATIAALFEIELISDGKPINIKFK